MSGPGVVELGSERLVLRRSDAADEDAVLAFFVRNVDHLAPWLPEARPLVDDPSLMNLLRERGDAELRAGNEERWFFALADEPVRVVGYVFLTRFRRDGHRSCELSFGIDHELVGRGVMREAAARMLLHARETLGFTRVDARFSVDNPRSGALLERLGFVRVGVAPAHAWLDGAWHDHVLVTRVAREGPLVEHVPHATAARRRRLERHP